MNEGDTAQVRIRYGGDMALAPLPMNYPWLYYGFTMALIGRKYRGTWALVLRYLRSKQLSFNKHLFAGNSFKGDGGRLPVYNNERYLH